MRSSFRNLLRQVKVRAVLRLAEVAGLEQLLKTYDVGAPVGGLSYIANSFGKIRLDVITARHLDQTKVDRSFQIKPPHRTFS